MAFLPALEKVLGILRSIRIFLHSTHPPSKTSNYCKSIEVATHLCFQGLQRCFELDVKLSSGIHENSGGAQPGSFATL
ncbi:UNVERIFIED_ORG: hypothetical protein J2W87_001414 [Pseudomonas putida]|nr:hypothetical protein [Pseudomonas putida]